MSYESYVLGMSDVKFYIYPKPYAWPQPTTATHRWFNAENEQWLSSSEVTSTAISVGESLIASNEGESYTGFGVLVKTPLSGATDFSFSFIAEVNEVPMPEGLEGTSYRSTLRFVNYNFAYYQQSASTSVTTPVSGTSFTGAISLFPGTSLEPPEEWESPDDDYYLNYPNWKSLSFNVRRNGYWLWYNSDGPSEPWNTAESSNYSPRIPDTAEGTTPTDPWHVVYTRSATGEVKVYVNGELRDTRTDTGTLSGVLRFNIGNPRLNSIDIPIGKMQGFAGWQKVLTAEEVEALYEAATTVPEVPEEPPIAPATLTVSKIEDKSAQLDWAYSPITGFPENANIVDVDLDPDPGPFPVEMTGTALSLTLINLTPETEYTASVRTRNSAGASAWVTADFTTAKAYGDDEDSKEGDEDDPTGSGADPDSSDEPLNPGEPTTRPGPVGNLTVSDVQDTRADLSWNEPEELGNLELGSYFIRLEPAVDGYPRSVAPFKVDYTLKGLKPDTKYKAYVRARNAKGSSETRSVSFTTLKDETVKVCLSVNGKEVTCVDLPPGSKPNDPVDVRRDGRIITLIHDGRVVITYVMTEEENEQANLSTGWVGVTRGNDEAYTGPVNEYILPGDEPEAGYWYELNPVNIETGLGLTYPLNRYTHPVAYAVLFDQDGNLNVTSLPTQEEVGEASQRYFGGQPNQVQYETALAIYLAGYGHWLKQVV